MTPPPMKGKEKEQIMLGLCLNTSSMGKLMSLDSGSASKLLV